MWMRTITRARFFPAGIFLLLAAVAFAYSGHDQNGSGDAANPEYNPNLDFAQIEYVKATEVSAGVWRFDVTVRHNDEGWGHYADAWQVADPRSGKIVGERILAHPHDNEQPFTRSQGGIAIPKSLNRVLVQAKCNVHGFGGRKILLDFTQQEGEGYQVQRR